MKNSNEKWKPFLIFKLNSHEADIILLLIYDVLLARVDILACADPMSPQSKIKIAKYPTAWDDVKEKCYILWKVFYMTKYDEFSPDLLLYQPENLQLFYAWRMPLIYS